MKFIVSSSYLLKQLQVLGGVINSSNTLPILDNFLFELDNNTLTVSGSDLETTMSAKLEVESSDSGMVAVPARLLLDTLKTFPEQPLTFVVGDNNTVEISSNHGKYALAYADGEEFPKAVELEDPAPERRGHGPDGRVVRLREGLPGVGLGRREARSPRIDDR